MGHPHFDGAFQSFCREVHREPSLSVTPPTFAVEFQRLFQSERAWVLLPRGTRFEVAAVGGIAAFQRRAEVVANLEDLATQIARTHQPFDWQAGTVDSNASPRLRQALDRYLDRAHVSGLYALPLFEPKRVTATERQPDQPRVAGLILCEWFELPAAPILELPWAAAQQQAEIALQNASDWSNAPLASQLRLWRRGVSWPIVTRWTTVLLIVAVALILCGLWPIDFTIEAVGELQPKQQRHIFAAMPGIVRSLSVTSGATVSPGDLLLELDCPELELEIRRIEGEQQTAEKRIAAIEASRLDFGLTSADTANQLNSLAGELKEQRQKRENYQRELELLSERREELRIVSPIQGRVVTWDLERLLSRRPVARGQRLLTISNTAGPWELELRVRDEDSDDLRTALKHGAPVALDFITVTMPDRVHSTTMTSISETVEIRALGDTPSLLCRAEAPDDVARSAVEGVSVRGRIHCGRKAMIVVLFDKVWKQIRENILFPLGW